jgi:pyruvate dehydrogenase E2 component (dihydrolipoamide acetyltransferase)
VTPTGEEGRVLDADVQTFADERGVDETPATKGKAERNPASQSFDFSQFGPTERQPLRSVRRKTAERMARAWSKIPHVTHHDELDITELETWRKRVASKVEAAGGKLSLTVLVMKALAANLHEFPRFNASLDAEQEELIFKHYVNIGVAVDTERGLLVPVVRDVAAKSLKELSKEVLELSERTRKGESARRDLTGSSFTITNVGPLGGTGFTPIINYPEVAILGLARATLQSVHVGDLDDHQTSTRLLLPVSLAFDHRVIDGAEAARFVRRLGERLADLEDFVLDT